MIIEFPEYDWVTWVCPECEAQNEDCPQHTDIPYCVNCGLGVSWGAIDEINEYVDDLIVISEGIDLDWDAIELDFREFYR